MALDKTQELTVTLHLAPKTPLFSPAAVQLTPDDYLEQHGPVDEQWNATFDYCQRNGLAIVEAHKLSRTIHVSGTIDRLEDLFGTTVHDAGSGLHFHTVEPKAPEHLGIQHVLGFDTRPIAKPHFRVHASSAAELMQAHAAGGPTPLWAKEIMRLYGAPTGLTPPDVDGIAIIELGGAEFTSDTQQAMHDQGLPAPVVSNLSVDGGQPSHSDADGEVALDVQVAAAAYAFAFGKAAKVYVYYAPNTDQGFVDAILAAAHSGKVAVISVSWGGPESNWSDQARGAMDNAIKAAGLLGVTVIFAAGDDGSRDGTGSDVVDYPAASPWSLGIGGTRLVADGSGQIASETVWNEGPGSGATGGGLSKLYPIPTWQMAAAPKGQGNRGVPDVASVADPATGYWVYVGGRLTPVGGTSSGPPLWSAIVLALASAAKKPMGFVNGILYQLPPTCWRDITQGSNGSFAAGPGYDLCTGLGSPRVDAIMAAVGGQPQPPSNPPPANPPPAQPPSNPPPVTTPPALDDQLVRRGDVRAALRKVFDAEIAAMGRHWYGQRLLGQAQADERLADQTIEQVPAAT